ncbi:MAG: hypothetical protein FJ264_08990 [Planctomycetes bacterium]|nr:hypothetical protein [Planctomycetota bacterium]
MKFLNVELNHLKMVYKILLILFCLCLFNLPFMQYCFSHIPDISQKTGSRTFNEPHIRAKMVSTVDGYKATLFYYPVGNTNIYDFSVQLEVDESEMFYRESLEFQIIDQHNTTCISYTPFLSDGNTYKMRQVLEKDGKYRFLIIFDENGHQRHIGFSLELQQRHTEDKCQWCGMEVEDSKTTYFLLLNNHEEKKACCVHCAVNYKNTFRDTLIRMETIDFPTGKRVESSKTWLVQNPDITIENSMPPFIIAFETKQSAIDFQKTYNGDVIDYTTLEQELLMEMNATDLLPLAQEDDPPSSFMRKFLTAINENYYQRINAEALKNKSIEEILNSLDKNSSLQKIEPSSLDFIRGFERDETIAYIREIHAGIGYIKIHYFGRRTKEDFKSALLDINHKKLKGLIIDIRNNPGGSLEEAADIMQYFVPNGSLIATFTTKERTVNYFAQTDEKWTLPLVVLLNNNTASSAEIFAAGLRYYKKAILAGTNSYGKGTIQKPFPLDHEHTLVLTIGTCSMADGTMVEDSGITPDFTIAGEQEQIRFAIEFFEK